ncbi:MAG: hypothetical protein EHM41_16995, partial [Chloroflexi bacterium]
MSKYDLSFSPPIMNAAGFLGFSPSTHSSLDLSQLGAFVTNPVSLEPRTPAGGTRCISFPGGFLLHTGHPNPGLKSVINRHSVRWKRSNIPIIVHVLGQGIDETARVIHKLEEIEGVGGVELGLPPGIDPSSATALVRAARGEFPLIVRLPLEDAQGFTRVLKESDVSAFSLSAPRGALLDSEKKLVYGRIYGPALFPQVLASVKTLARGGVPIIA